MTKILRGRHVAKWSIVPASRPIKFRAMQNCVANRKSPLLAYHTRQGSFPLRRRSSHLCGISEFQLNPKFGKCKSSTFDKPNLFADTPHGFKKGSPCMRTIFSTLKHLKGSTCPQKHQGMQAILLSKTLNVGLKFQLHLRVLFFSAVDVGLHVLINTNDGLARPNPLLPSTFSGWIEKPINVRRPYTIG